jgi:hypothetical protein
MAGSKPRARPVFVSLLAVVLPAAVAGCGPKTGTVAGKVSVDGRPINAGIVSFLGAEVEPGARNSSTGTIHADGSYLAHGVPVGPIKVCIIPDIMSGIMSGGRARRRPLPPPGMPAALLAPTAAPVQIPPKYTKFDTSGLTLTVQGGRNPFDIVMTSK